MIGSAVMNRFGHVTQTGVFNCSFPFRWILLIHRFTSVNLFLGCACSCVNDGVWSLWRSGDGKMNFR